ncbi:GTPase ObgE [Bernardetia sp.]|uniref:GTPase ObgE n=1 Tax=Bernardetia sp. TaxID=1937974 RepID=UPI0025C3E18C|nr:GTPase ObgE [Bernardetia sp.]
MDSPNFIDYVKLFLRSGKGGAGSTHFRREKHVPLGGPDGGDGGRGGHIILRANAQLWTLLHLRYQKHVFAQDGENGSGQKSYGKQGEDTILEVPLGTVVKDAETGEKVAEVLEDGQEVIILHGGRGGLGNFHFRNSINQAPEYSQPGEPFTEGWFTLELKVLADVGLVGFPNAGKSTLLSVISAAKPKIANYAFTTLVPNLGVVPYRDHRSFVVADIPGIIEGAAEGKGLGVRFLRHIERNSMLLFVISADAKNIKEEYDILVGELEKYNPELLDKKRFLAISKMDLIDDELKSMLEPDLPKDIPHLFISAVTQANLDILKDKIWENLQR